MHERLVLGLVPDLLFASQIEQALERLGYRVELVADAAALVQRAAAARPAVVLVDLAARGIDAPAAIRALKTDPATAAVPVVAFGPHRDTAARAAAVAAGADAVVANARLAFDLPRLVARHAAAE